MSLIWRSALWAAMAIACLGSAAAAEDPSARRALAVSDVTTLEAFGRGSISPDGRWAVYEKRGRYDALPRFDWAQRSAWAGMEVWRVDLADPGAAPERLFAGEGPGIMQVAWSPSGDRLLIHRFQDGRFEFGVATMDDLSVRWTGLTPEIPTAGATAAWVSDDAVIVLIRPDRSLPQVMRYYSGVQDRTTGAWERTSLGREPSRTVVETSGGVARTEAAEPGQALVLIDLAGEGTRTLVTGGIIDFSLSPDRRRLAVVSEGEPIPMASGPILQAEADRRRRVSIVSLADGALARPAPGLDIAPHLLRWSADSRAVLVWAREDAADWDAGGLAEVTPDGVTLVDRGGLSAGTSAEIRRGVRADWLGDRPVLRARRGEDPFDWFVLEAGGPPRSITGAARTAPASLAAVTQDEIRFFADGGLWVADGVGTRRVAASGVRDAAAGDAEAAFRLRSNEAPRRDWVVATGSAGETLVVRADGTVDPLGSGPADDLRSLAVSEGAALVLTRSGLVETLRLRTADGERPIDTVNSRLADVGLPRPRPVDHIDGLGRPTRSWLFLPEGREVGDVAGLIVQPYPGATESGVWSGPLTLTYGIRAEVLAGAGFAVLSPSMPADAAAPPTAAFRSLSIELAVDAALEAFPALAPDRIAVVGHSFGGLAALEIAARSTRYRAIVASSAPTDAFGFWGEFDVATRIQPEDGVRMRNQQGWVEAGQAGLGQPPWREPDAYQAFSPWLSADRIAAPVLLLTADLDYVPVSQSERVFSVLHRQGRRARIVTYWGEHHALWSPANIQDRYHEIIDWVTAGFAEPR